MMNARSDQTDGRGLIVTAAVCGALAVVLGAFAAHGAELDARTLLTTAGHYLLVHAVLAVACGFWGERRAITAGALALGGASVFCLALSAIALFGLRWMGAVAPIGGVLMILGWLLLGHAAWRQRRAQDPS